MTFGRIRLRGQYGHEMFMARLPQLLHVMRAGVASLALTESFAHGLSSAVTRASGFGHDPIGRRRAG